MNVLFGVLHHMLVALYLEDVLHATPQVTGLTLPDSEYIYNT